ncbi:MaoC/PaaZ C-terminal domain-containing protein [Nocardia sp. NPDC051990]|uniref:MaoC/PaaZ C-terminal domain-containing protein n=1 Tax=Nocardia sp. NPDC051990 TaxID=3155285 RepID=UPI003440DDB7
MHVDPERAVSGCYGTTIAPGHATLSLLPPLMADLFPSRTPRCETNTAGTRCASASPVPAGSRIRGRAQIASVDVVSGGLRIVPEPGRWLWHHRCRTRSNRSRGGRQ